MIVLDGSYGEGGGQILRSALTLAILTGQGFRIEDIRGRRKRPGLRPQHLACVRAAAAISSATVSDASIGSRELTFYPGHTASGDYRFDVGSAGSTSLVLQTILLPLLMAKGVSTVFIKGGTHVPWSPCFHYLDEVFRPALELMGARFALTLLRWGFYPKGGGTIRATIEPSSLETPFRPATKVGFDVKGVSAASKLPHHVAIRQAESAERLLQSKGVFARIESLYPDAISPGSVLFLWFESDARFGGFTAYGRRGRRAETVGEEAASGLLSFLASGAQVDSRLSDQLILPALFAPGKSQWSTDQYTLHLKTNIWVASQFGFKEIGVKKIEENLFLVTVSGT